MHVATSSRLRSSPIRSAAGLLLALFLCTYLVSPSFADVRIGEILANPFGSNDGRQKVELQNFGTAAVDISGWRVSNEFDSLTLPASMILDPGEILVLHIASSGTNSDSEIFTGDTWPMLGANQGSFGLFGPTGSFTDPDAMGDFVEWGAGDQLGEAVADDAGLWPAGDFVPLTSEGNSIQLCNRQVTGSGSWLEGDGNTIGGVNNCSTQVTPSTWGKVKNIYR
jgi:hypothetical protein